MASIADLFGRLLLDDSGFERAVVKTAGDASAKAGTTMSANISSSFRTFAKAGIQVGAGALAAGLGLATKGLLELQNIQADFTAETGATAEEAERAGKAINEMAGRNIQPMAEVGKALTKVHTDLGLTGEEAEKTTEQFLKFARATKQDAGKAVVAFDDILDAWGLTAEDSGKLMDNLVASHQKYGGSIEENQTALAKMAPQLKALNLDVDDGVALLNLFASSGLDASKSQTALNSAISKLPPGTTMDEFIAHLASIEDPAQRAKEAIEVFGVRGGAGLANAIRPGMDSLDDFKVSTEEMTGATTEAADALDSTFGARAQLLLKGFSSKLIELGGSFGPVLTGLASLASLGGALGFGKLGDRISKGLAGAFKAAFGSTLVQGAIAKGGSLAATLYLKALIVGDAIAGGLATAWGKVPGSAKVGAAVRKAASAAATGYLKLLIVGDAIGSAISGAWTSVAGAGSKATKTAGLAGKAAGLAFKLGMLGLLVTVADDIKAQLSNVAKDLNIWKQLNIDAPDIHPEEWPWPLGPKGAPEWAGGGPSPAAALPIKIEDEMRGAREPITAAASDMVGGIPGALAAGTNGLAAGAENAFGIIIPAIDAGAEAWKKYEQDTADAQRQAITDQLDFTSKALSDLTGFQSGVEAALSGVYSAETDATVTKNRIIILEGELTAARQEQRDKGAKITAAERADFENRRIAIEGEMDQLRLHLALIGDDMHRVTALNALLTAKDLRTNLLSENDNIRTAAQVQRDKIIAYLQDIQTQGGPAAKSAAAILAQWLNPTNPLSPMHGVAGAAGTAATNYVENISDNVGAGTPAVRTKIERIEALMDLKSEAAHDGYNTGNAYVENLASGLAGTGPITTKLRLIARLMAAGSPPKPGAVLYGIDKWAASTGEAYINPFAAAIARLPALIRGSLARVATSLAQPMAVPPVTVSRQVTDTATPAPSPPPVERSVADVTAPPTYEWGVQFADGIHDSVTRLARTLSDAVTRAFEPTVAALGDKAHVFTPPLGAPAMSPIAMAGAGVTGLGSLPSFPAGLGNVGVGAGPVTNVHVTLPPSTRWETPSDVVRSLRHLNAYGTFGEERR